MSTYQDLIKAYKGFGDEFETENEPEAYRLEKIKMYVYIGNAAWKMGSDGFIVSRREERVRRRRRGRLRVCVV